MAPLHTRDDGTEPANPRGAELIRYCAAFTATAGVFVAFRIAIRAKRKVLGWDDFWIVVAFVSSILLTVTTIMCAEYGFGLHSGEVTDDEFRNALFWWYLNQTFYKGITWPTKVSILLMYRRVFLVADDIKAYGVQFRILIWATLAVVIGCFIGFQGAGTLQCTPIRRMWNVSVQGHCVNQHARLYAYAGFNFITDVIILLLPMPLIYGMTHISKRQKLGLMAVFALGGFVCVTTLLRIPTLNIKNSDILYSGQPSMLWTTVEGNVGIICACLPLMRSVIIYLIPWFADHTSSVHPRPSRIADESSSSAPSEKRNKQQSENGNDIPRNKDDSHAISYIEEGDAESVKSTDVVIGDNANFREP